MSDIEIPDSDQIVKKESVKVEEKPEEYNYTWTFNQNRHDKCGMYSRQTVGKEEFAKIVKSNNEALARQNNESSHDTISE